MQIGVRLARIWIWIFVYGNPTRDAANTTRLLKKCAIQVNLDRQLT